MKVRRIQNTLIRAFAGLIVFTIMLLGFLSIYSLRAILVTNAEQTTMQLVRELNRVIETYIKYMDDIALVAMNNEEVRTFMRSPADDSPALRRSILRSFEAIRSVRKDIDSVSLITRDGRAIAAASGGGLNPSVDLRRRFADLEAGLAPERPSVSSAHVENLVDESYPWVISLVRPIHGPQDGTGIGLILVDLNYDVIARLCRDIQLGTSGYVFILNGIRGDRLSSAPTAHLRQAEVRTDQRGPRSQRGFAQDRDRRPRSAIHNNQLRPDGMDHRRGLLP